MAKRLNLIRIGVFAAAIASGGSPGLCAARDVQPAFEANAALVQERIDRIATLLGEGGPIRLIVLESASDRDGEFEDGALSLSRATIKAADSARELDGLIATLIAFGIDRIPDHSAAGPPTLGEYAAAGAVAAIGGAIDKVDENDPSTRNRQAFRSPLPEERENKPSRDQLRASVALRLVGRAGSCSGPTIDVLSRIARRSSSGMGPQQNGSIAWRASRFLASFGSATYPPDYSCIAK